MGPRDCGRPSSTPIRAYVCRGGRWKCLLTSQVRTPSLAGEVRSSVSSRSVSLIYYFALLYTNNITLEHIQLINYFQSYYIITLTLQGQSKWTCSMRASKISAPVSIYVLIDSLTLPDELSISDFVACISLYKKVS
jgi:hypothetical protein